VTPESETAEHERRNRSFWDGDADAYQQQHGPDLERAPEAWGAWRIAESEIGALGLESIAGLDVLEYGCGAAQWSTALAARGARVVGLDQSQQQLHHARDRARSHDAAVPLVCASGESVPLAEASFDIVFCDHGALSFCDPARAVAECARLLRDGGRLVFCLTTPLVYLTWDLGQQRQTRRLQNQWEAEWMFDSGEGTIDFVWSAGAWIRVFRRNGFEVDDLIELRPPKGATTTYSDFIPYRWARRWPAEQIWCVTRRR
jgi:SAM-dependent methyltransferase